MSAYRCFRPSDEGMGCCKGYEAIADSIEDLWTAWERSNCSGFLQEHAFSRIPPRFIVDMSFILAYHWTLKRTYTFTDRHATSLVALTEVRFSICESQHAGVCE